jgi:hypothetical protein
MKIRSVNENVQILNRRSIGEKSYVDSVPLGYCSSRFTGLGTIRVGIDNLSV